MLPRIDFVEDAAPAIDFVPDEPYNQVPASGMSGSGFTLPTGFWSDVGNVWSKAKEISDPISHYNPLTGPTMLGKKVLQTGVSMIPTGSQEAWESGVGAARDVARRIPTGLLTGSGITAPFLYGFGDRGSGAPPDTETTQRTAAFGRAIAEQAKGLAEFTVSDLGLATIAAGGPIAGAAAKVLPWAGRAIKTLISAGFTADIASKLPDQYEKYLIAQEHGTPAEQEVATVELWAPLAMLAGTTLHTATGAGKMAASGAEKIGSELTLGRAVRGQAAPVAPELGPQFVPGIAGTKGMSFGPISPVEHARRLGLTQTADSASKITPLPLEDLNTRLATYTEQSGLVRTPKGAENVPIAPPVVTTRNQMEVRLPSGEPPSTIQNLPWTPIEVKLFKRLRAKADAAGQLTNPSIEDLKNRHGGRIPPEISEQQSKGGEIPNATQTETPVGGASQTSTGTAPLVEKGPPSGGGQPGGARTETTQGETPALTTEAPAVTAPVAPPPAAPPAPPVTPAVPPTPPPPTPPPIIPPLGDYERPAGSPIGIKNADINALRVSMGMDPIEKAVGMPDAETWQRVMDRIDQDKDWIDTIIKDIKETGRGHTADEALALDHRLVEIRTEFDRAAREAAKAQDAGDVVAEAQAQMKVNLWSDKLAELSQVTTSSGTAMGRAFRARQFRLNEDFSLAALETRKRKANDWRPLNEAERAEIAKTHAEYVAKTAELEAHLAEQSGKRVDAEIKLAAAEAARGPSYDPRLLKIVEDFAGFMDKQATSAMDRIKARHSGKGEARIDFSLGTLDVAADVADLAIYGAAKITRKINDFTKWSDAMIGDFGKGVEPHLEAAWEASKVLYQKSLDERLKTKDPATQAKAKAALTGQDVAEKIETAKDKIAAKVEKGQQNAIFYQVQELVRGIVERDPKITRGLLINEVHGVLKEFMPDIEKMDTMDAISGVGRFNIPKQDIVSKAVRELKTQTRLASHFIRVLMQEPLPRTGYQHGKLSDVSRNLTTRINKAKRKFPLEPSDPESQLGSILQSRKTYYTNRMADLQSEIKARKRRAKTTTPSPTDPELDALIEEYTTVKREHDEIFGRPELTDAQKLERLESSATRRITELQRQLDMDEVFAKSKKPSTLSSEKLAAQRARIDALVAERDYVRMRAKPDPGMDPFVMAIIHARARITRKIADYTQRVADGDYAPRTRKPPVDITQDARAMSLMADLTKVKRDFDTGLALDEAKKRTKFVKFMAGTAEVLNLPRAIWSAFDLSAVGRQGATMLMGHPIRSARSVMPMIKALFSEKSALIEEQKIINRPNYQNGNYAKSDLYLASLDEFRLSRQEEIMMSRFANLIPGVRASNRAFMTYLNKLRADSFDVMLKSRERWFTKPVEQFEKNAISNYINISTGRGNLGNHAAAAQTLATIFWAPRLMASRIQYLVGQPLWKGGARVRTMVAKEYAQTLMGMGAVIGLGAMAGADVETDPNSSDFLKLKFGKARVDIMGGLLQNIVAVNRLLISGKIKTASGKVKPIKGGDVVWNFARNKFSPAIGTALDIRDLAFGQKPPAGHPQSLGNLALNLPVPLSFRDVYTMLKEEGVPETTALTLVSTLGWGVQYYDSLAGEKPSAKPTYPDSMFRPRTPTPSP